MIELSINIFLMISYIIRLKYQTVFQILDNYKSIADRIYSFISPGSILFNTNKLSLPIKSNKLDLLAISLHI